MAVARAVAAATVVVTTAEVATVAAMREAEATVEVG